MADVKEELPVNIYFVWQWWEKHYQNAFPRPDVIDPDWLDETYLGRQRFLHDHFGRFGIGRAVPSLDTGFLSRVIPFNTMIIAVALGMNTTAQKEGGYRWLNLSEQELKKLRPVNIADTWLGELLTTERDKKLSRYGVVEQMIDLASVSNNAFMLRGQEFYADLITEKSFAGHYLGVIRETMCTAYRFIGELFGPINGFPLANCNVTMMSPEVYTDMVREYDIQCVEYAARLTGKSPYCNLHHCNVRVDPFVEAYSAIPGLRSLQGSHLSDIRKIHRFMSKTSFSAMVNPVDLLTKPAEQLDAELDNCLANKPGEVVVWDIDPAYDPSKVRDLFSRIELIAARNKRKAVFSVIPVTWEELDWEFPVYRDH